MTKMTDREMVELAVQMRIAKEGKNKNVKSWCCIEVENTGWSDPENPSWFTCTDGRDPLRFSSIEEAVKFKKKQDKVHDFKHRVVIKTVSEVYI